MSKTSTQDDLIRILLNTQERIEAAIASIKGVMLTTDHLIQSAPGLYLRSEGNNRYQPVGVEDATWYSESTAYYLVNSLRSPGDPNRELEAVPLREALEEQLQETRDFLSMIRSLPGCAN